jgi:hypothetical protein
MIRVVDGKLHLNIILPDVSRLYSLLSIYPFIVREIDLSDYTSYDVNARGEILRCMVRMDYFPSADFIKEVLIKEKQKNIHSFLAWVGSKVDNIPFGAPEGKAWLKLLDEAVGALSIKDLERLWRVEPNRLMLARFLPLSFYPLHMNDEDKGYNGAYTTAKWKKVFTERMQNS